MERSDLAAAGIREEGQRLVQLYLSGDRVGALQRALDLANAHGDSPMALILLADLYRDSAHRADRSDLKERLNKEAEHCYRKAVGMLPNCIDTRVCLGEVLADRQFCQMAEVELTLALEMEHALDPADNVLAYGVSSSRPLRSSARTRINDVRKRARDARERNRASLAPSVNSTVERVMALRQSNVALKRAGGTASMYPFSVRVHLLHAHVTMEMAYALPNRVRKSALQRALAVLDSAECDLQKSVIVSVFRAKLLFILHDYAVVEEECRRGLRIKGADDPGQQDVPPGSVCGCTMAERIYSCRAQLLWLLAKLVTESISFYLTAPDQHASFLSFRFSSLLQRNSGSHSFVEMIHSAEKQFDRYKNSFAWICPSCSRRNLATPSALIDHIILKHSATLRHSEMLKSVVTSFEGSASQQQELPSDVLTYDADNVTFHFQDVFSLVKSVTEAQEISFFDLLQKKRREAANIYEKICQELIVLPTERSSPQDGACSEVLKLWKELRDVCKLDLLLPLARLTRWRDFLKHMSAEMQKSDMEITDSVMERIFNTHQELPFAVADEPETSDNATDDSGQPQPKEGQNTKIIDPSAKERPKISHKGHPREAPALEKMLKPFQQYLSENSDDAHNIVVILQFLFRMRIFRDEILRGSFSSEVESQLRNTLCEIFSEWKRQEYARMNELVNSFKEVLLHGSNDSATCPQVRQAYASEAVAMVLKRLQMCIPSYLGIKMLFNTSCGCGGLAETEKVILMVKFDTACVWNTQVTSFSQLEVLHDEPHQCLKCGMCRDIDVSFTEMPKILQIALDSSTGSSCNPSSLNELMVKLNSPQEISFFCRGLQSSMKYKLTSMICWSKGLYVFFGRDKKRWILLDRNTAKVIEFYKSGTLQADILCFESVQGVPPWSGPPDIVQPQEGTSSSQEILPTPEQHFRSSGGKTKLTIEEDEDEEKQLHLSFKAKMDGCTSGLVPCLACHLKGVNAKPMKGRTIIMHYKNFHSGAGIQCSKTGCLVRATNRGDIGKHEMYCHTM